MPFINLELTAISAGDIGADMGSDIMVLALETATGSLLGLEIAILVTSGGR
jgi:hypothetical protein